MHQRMGRDAPRPVRAPACAGLLASCLAATAAQAEAGAGAALLNWRSSSATTSE